MSIRFAIDVAQRLIIVTFSGEIDDTEVLGLASLVRSHPDFDPSFSAILDLSGVTGGSLSTSTIQQLSHREGILRRTSMHVIVAPGDYIFGLARMLQMLSEPMKPNIIVLRTIAEAYQLLGREKSG